MSKTIISRLLPILVASFLVAFSFSYASEPIQKTYSLRMIKEAKTSHPQLTAMEAMDLILGKENLIIIDVRKLYEFICERIPGAINIPIEIIEVKTVQKFKDLNQPILVYSRTGDLGALAGLVLKKIGYTSVNNLAGGLESWVGPREKLPAGDPKFRC